MSSNCLLGRDFMTNPNIQQIIFTENNIEVVCKKPNSDFLTIDVLLIENVFDYPNVDIDIDSSLTSAVVSETKEIFVNHYLNNKRPLKPKVDFKMHLNMQKHEPFFTFIIFGEISLRSNTK